MDIRIEIDEKEIENGYYDSRMINAILRTNNGKGEKDLKEFALEEWKREFPHSEQLVKRAIITIREVSNYNGGKIYITLDGNVKYETIMGVNFDMAWWVADFFKKTLAFDEVRNNMLSRIEPDADINDIFRMLWSANDQDKVPFMFHPTKEFAKELWEDFKDMPTNKRNELIYGWRDFPAGTDTSTVHAWFEAEFPINSVKFTLMKDYSDL